MLLPCPLLFMRATCTIAHIRHRVPAGRGRRLPIDKRDGTAQLGIAEVKHSDAGDRMASFLQSFVRTPLPPPSVLAPSLPPFRHLSSTYIPFGPSSSSLFAAAVTALLLLRRRCRRRRTRTDLGVLGRLCAPQKRRSKRYSVSGTDGGDEPMTDCRPRSHGPSASEGSGLSLCFGEDGERRPSRERGANLEEGMAARRGVDRGR